MGVIFGIITSFLTLVGRAPVLRHREVGVVGGAGGDVWAAVVGTLRTGAHHLQIVAVLA